MWVINIFLLLCFLFNQPAYHAMVAAGEPCFTNIVMDGERSNDKRPVCFYDPSNLNQ